MPDTGKYARCNQDGRPLHPGDQAAISRFGRWLALGERGRAAAFAGLRRKDKELRGPLCAAWADSASPRWEIWTDACLHDSCLAIATGVWP